MTVSVPGTETGIEPDLAKDARKRHGRGATIPAHLAAETIWALVSPELHTLLTGVRGCPRDRYEAWLRDALTTLLLAPDPLSSGS